MVSKAQKRNEFKTLLRQQVKDQDSLTALFSRQLQTFFKDEQGIWAAFRPLVDEPPVLMALQSLTHIDWCYPKVQGEHLEFFHPHEGGWLSHSLGMDEPAAGEFVTTQDLQGFLIPGLGFSSQGYRLGRGKGYYDRSLPQAPGVRVGVCYEFQFCEDIGPVEKHDLKMDYLITEKNIYSFPSERT